MNDTAKKLLESVGASMTLSHARYLIEASRRVFVGHDSPKPVETPSLELLLSCEARGGRTAYDPITETVYRFDFDESKARKAVNNLTEDPDKVAGKYYRDQYHYELFVGDEHGFLIGNAITHSVLLRRLRQCGAVTDQYWFIEYQNLPEGIQVIGKPKGVDTRYSGVILPKQDGVDATYVSCWSDRCESIVPLLTEYVKSQYNAPFKLEMGSNEDLSGSFEVRDI